MDGLIHNIIRTKRKTIALQITPEAKLIVRAPAKASIAAIHKIVREKLSWIIKKQRFIRANYRPPVEKKFVEGENFLYLGRPYGLSIVKEMKEPLVFECGRFLLHEKYLSAAKRIFESWYKKEAGKFFRSRIALYSEICGLKYNKFKITGGRRRLGSCSAKGAINLSWRLIMTPVEVIDYVIAHELTHLKEHNHSKDFWRGVQSLYPDYKKTRAWLKANNSLLTI